MLTCSASWREAFKFSVKVFPPEHKSGWRSVKCCFQLLLSLVSRAVTLSHGREISQLLCAFLCFSVFAPAWMCIGVRLCASDETFMQSLYAAQTHHFPNEPLPWQRQQCVGWRHGNRLLPPTPRQGVVVVLCVTVLVCVCVCVRGRSSHLCCLRPRSLSLQWWRVTELWYLSLPRDSLILQSPTLHSSSPWHQWITTICIRVNLVSFGGRK